MMEGKKKGGFITVALTRRVRTCQVHKYNEVKIIYLLFMKEKKLFSLSFIRHQPYSCLCLETGLRHQWVSIFL